MHEKRILFYPDGDRRNFFKFLADRFLLYFLIAVCIFGLSWLGMDYWKSNSENERYKYAFHWVYQFQTAKGGKQVLYNAYKEFQNDSIFKLRKENINPTFSNN